MRVDLLLPTGSFDLEIDEKATILDAMEYLRSGEAPQLRYRHSCHHGSCGTCGALVNGRPVLMCLTALAPLAGAPIRVEPLPKMQLIGDLAVDPSDLFITLPDTDYHAPSKLPHENPKPEGGEWLRFEACIECGICVAACPVRVPFLGPAALAAADAERQKHRGRAKDMLVIASGEDGVPACQKAFACSRACPQSVAPGRRIQNLRLALGNRTTR